MGKPQRIVKLNGSELGTPLVGGAKRARGSSVAGSTVIADYYDELGWRTLVFERPEPAAKPRVARRKHRKAAQVGTAADGATGVTSGS